MNLSNLVYRVYNRLTCFFGEHWELSTQDLQTQQWHKICVKCGRTTK